MTGYRISDVADRSGFSAATLRYYEEIGLLPPPGRSAAGYRVYDERALGRLAFVARAKELGLSLEEIGDLTRLWEGDECGPVQRRLADFVAGKLALARSRVAELTALADRLRAVAARLAQEPDLGPCDDSCACHSPADAAPQDSADASVSCTLTPAQLPGRLAAWSALTGRAVDREPLAGGVRLRFRPDAGLAAELAGLAQAEQGCCAFFDFTVGIGAGALTLDVRGPGDAQPVIAGLFGAAS